MAPIFPASVSSLLQKIEFHICFFLSIIVRISRLFFSICVLVFAYRLRIVWMKYKMMEIRGISMCMREREKKMAAHSTIITCAETVCLSHRKEMWKKWELCWRKQKGKRSSFGRGEGQLNGWHWRRISMFIFSISLGWGNFPSDLIKLNINAWCVSLYRCTRVLCTIIVRPMFRKSK